MFRLTLSVAATACLGGCCSAEDRLLDPAHPEPLRVQMRMRFEPGLTDRSKLETIEPGEILVFTTGDQSMFVAAFGKNPRAGISVPFGLKDEIRVLTADPENGVDYRMVSDFVRGRAFYVYAFPEGSLNINRLRHFAERAVLRGTSDYDYSGAFFGWNSNIVPNSPDEVGDEYTCAAVVAAALHYSGLSLDSACGNTKHISPGDLIHSPARRNQNFHPESK